MGLLSTFFSRKAQKDYFPPPAATAPPVPTEHWGVIVDAAGDPVTDRPAAATDFLARWPVEYTDGGTVPGYAPDKSKPREENLRRMVQCELRAQKNSALLKKAVFLLSQTDDGRRLLQLAKQEKFSIVFDSEKVGARGAAGLCDYANKQIPLLEGLTPVDVALTLKHELQHMEDIKNGFGGGYNQSMRDYVAGDRALEGNARVSEAVAAAELLLGSPHGPAQQFRSAALFADYFRGLPHMADAARQALPDAAAGNWQSFAQKVLPAYYKEKQTLAFYEKDYLDALNKLVPDVAEEKRKMEATNDWKHRDVYRSRINSAVQNAAYLFSGKGGMTAEKIANAISIKGVKYMQTMNKAFDVMGDEAVAFSKQGMALVQKFRAVMDNAIPGHEKAAAMTLPEAKPANPLPPVLNPYAKFAQPVKEEGFEVIRMPYRTDGNKLTNGMRSNESTTQLMADYLKNVERGPGTRMDHVNYAVGMYLHDNARVANLRGLMCDLLDAGFKAPIGALPDNYLFDLWGRLQMSADDGRTGGRSSVSPQEMALVQHWKDLADKGLDPLWIDKENQKKSSVATDRQISFYGAMIAKSVSGAAAAANTVAPALR